MDQARTERIERIAEGRRQGKTVRQLAEQEGVSLGQVQRDLATVSDTSEDTNRNFTSGLTGKKRPSRSLVSAGTDAMSKADRENLLKLVRQAAKLHKTAAEQLKAEQIADFERQLATIHKPKDDALWREIHDEAERSVAEADAKIAASCRERGIREDWRPTLNLIWSGRGENASKDRRAELRKVAEARAEANYKKALTAIEMHAVNLQSQLVAGGLESDAARAFLEAMPTPESLMPALSVSEIEAQLAFHKPKTGYYRDDYDD
jgi:hypothetical protein